MKATTLAYGPHYQRIRKMLLDPPVLCAHCQRARATTLDHDPPLATHVHRPGSGCCRLIPSCERCNRAGGKLVADGSWRPGASPLEDDLPAERAGLGVDDPRWRVPWLRELRPVPADATWPRLMTVPHPAAVGSLESEVTRAIEERVGRPLRWWQRLVLARLLEVDERGRLVWEALVLSMARQLGKSWLLRELIFWRTHQGERFGEPQDVLHTGKEVAICREIQRPIRVWAKGQPAAYKVREVNGQEEIERLEDGSRWMLRAKDAVYGYAGSVGAVDEAWKVKASSVEEGLVPTMIEREQSQLWLVSTAHRMATPLMLGRRSLALNELETGKGDLLIEWSAPAEAELDDVRGWRQASPHWSDRRERDVAAALERARSGETSEDETDPVESFRAQWLNQWPRRRAEPSGPVEDLLPSGLWAELAEKIEPGLEPVWVALEDDVGFGAAVAACRRLEDGRIEVDGWLCADWDSAIADAERVAALRRVRQLTVGASLLDRLPAIGPLPRPQPAAGSATRHGLAVFRDLAAGGGLVHDETTVDLDQALAAAQVRESSAGLILTQRGRALHLVRAAVWAVASAHRRTRVPAIH